MSPEPTTRATEYTPAERLVLTQHYATAPRAILLAGCPGRSWKSIKDAASRLGLSRPHPQNWLPAHVAILREHYRTSGVRVVGALTGRSASSIRDKAWQEGIRYEGKRTQQARPQLRAAAKELAETRARLKRAAKQAARARKPAKVKPVKAPKPPKVLLEKVEAKALPTPGVQSNVNTPVLNAQKAARLAAQKLQQQQKQLLAIVPAADIAKLAYTHPARMAYMLNAKHGGAAASRAFHQVMNTLKQAA